MKNALLLFGLFVSLVPSLFAQTDNTAPVVWERYKYSDLEISINLPKLPVVTTSHDPCSEELRRSTFAYAEGAVYELVVMARVAPKVRPVKCGPTDWTIDQSVIDRRLEELRGGKDPVETKSRVGELEAYQFTQERSVRLIIPDITHQRWIELAITHYPKEAPAIDRYFKSLQLDAASGTEIGEGAKATLGDPVAQTVPTEIPNAAAISEKTETSPSRLSTGAGAGAGSGFGVGSGSGAGSGSGVGDGTGSKMASPGPINAVPLQIVAKPQARYTDAARKNNVQGSVRLKATLLASGHVGSVTPLTTLEDGLTEQAIFAARRLVFVPARVNGIAISKTITIDYGFTIY